uniref:von Willebrand factor A domain containing 3A n=1 Tax=Anser brachyrhynchus TaxID=132585 RepID=A0A8B9BR14_9AVES
MVYFIQHLQIECAYFFFIFFSSYRLREARQWVQQLAPGGGCNLLKALKHVLTMKELNSLVIIVGSCTNQPLEILADYAQQCMLGRKLLAHVVIYDCSSPTALVSNCVDTHFLQCPFIYFLSSCSVFSHILCGDVSTEFANTATSSFLPKPPKHEGPLVIQTPCFLAKTSTDWLKTNGLKAKKLNLYQVLAPNAFSPVEEFVPILQKTVSSTLHEKVMMQFEWHDGTMKNIHVDLPVLYNYQKLLAKMVRIYEKRIDWLSVASRRIWGSVCEKRVVILVDISATNSMYIIHIQHYLRLLLEEQMSDKDYFNIIAFGSDIVPWQLELVPSQPENLQKAWRWVLSLQCRGSRNFMSALRRAVEVDFKYKDKHKSQGLYLLTTGIPDQETHLISTYMAEVCRGFDLQLHVCLFSVMEDVDSSGIIPARYANPTETAIAFKEIVPAANGRFHWFGEAGIFESDDITVIVSEIEKANNYSQKCAFLVESLKQRSGNQSANPLVPEASSNMLVTKEKRKPQKLPSPKPTALSLARMVPNATLFIFLLGTVYQKYPKTMCTRKSVPSVTLPKKEEICSSKEWLTKYSIKKLKLELPRLMFGPSCTHRKKIVESLHKKVSAKYCTIFPSVEVNGVVKHLQVQSKQLEIYTEQMEKVLQRYLQRIQWLLSGSRRLFGTILEANVCVLIDTSGSMDPYLPHITKELASLIWEQLRKNEVSTETQYKSLFAFSFKALSFQDIEALYVLTDGKPDTSCSLILKEIESLRKKQDIKIHTISFSCADREANEFLKKLASQTGGRYHCSFGDVDGQLAAHRMLVEGFDDEDDPVFPYFEGDDLKKLTEEVAKARSFLKQAKSLR